MTGAGGGESETLTARAARGAGWALLGRGTSTGLSIAFSLVLWRKLGPADFGLVAMVMAVVYVLGDVRDLRLADALIRRREVSGAQLDSVFFAHVGAGLLLSGLMAAGAWALGLLVEHPLLVRVAMVLALKPFIESLSDVSRVLLVRRLAFHRIAAADVAALVAGGVCGVAAAWTGYGPWALVALNLVNVTVASGMMIVAAGWRPGGRASLGALRGLGEFSLYLYGARNLTTFGRHVDKMLVGGFLGATALGLYDRGFQLMRLPLERIAEVVSRVMYAALSEIRDDVERLRNAYLRSVRMLSLVTFPITLGLCVTARELVLVIGREQWAGAIPLVRILCAAAAVESVTMTVIWIFFVTGRTRREFGWTCVSAALTAAAVLTGVRYGVEGVAWAYLARTVALTVPTFLVAFRLIELRLWGLARALAPTALAAGVMVAAVWGLRGLLLAHTGVSLWGLLSAEVGCGVVVYAGCLWLGKAAVCKEAWAIVSNFSGRCLPEE